MLVYIPQAVSQVAVQQLEELGYEVKVGEGFSEEEMIRDVADADAMLLRTALCPESVLKAGKKLKIVARHGTGYNNVDIEAANRLGIIVTNTPDAMTNSVAEFTIGAMLEEARRVVLLHDKLQTEPFFYKNSWKGCDLKGKTLGIVGFGRIGKAVAEKAYYGFGMKIMAVSHHAEVPDYVELVELDTVLEQADFISLHIPGGKQNQNLFDEAAFTKMKKQPVIINMARGDVIDETALYKAAQEKKIAGAFLDVMAQEPFDMASPLFSLDNVTIVPHIGANTVESMNAMATQAADQIHKVLSGRKPDWQVNHPVQKE